MDEGDLTTEAILEAALAAFGAHGFKATSLSQIATAAKVSRPTLYARYPDKVHLFRAVLQRSYEDALASAREAAEGPGPFEEVLRGVLLGFYGTLFDRFHGLPQIDELILVQSEEAEDVVLEARERFRKLLGRTLRQQVERGGVDAERVTMPIAQLVDLIRLAPLSLKTPSTTRARYRRGLTNFARLVAQALSGPAG
ncbi:MAG: TetR/AcrR family transcriptional regulator [Myxococcota bacterium]|nr:TetR/AcrR family transcriptional regulator [Myxococcota bacterium]